MLVYTIDSRVDYYLCLHVPGVGVVGCQATVCLFTCTILHICYRCVCALAALPWLLGYVQVVAMASLCIYKTYM